MRRYDLAIVGGSFAGLACAAASASRGLSVVVLERKRALGASPHTTGILVKEAADEWDVPRRLVRKVSGVRLYAPSLRSMDLHRPGYHFLATDTPGLLRWFGGQARERGALVRCDAPFTSARRAEGAWVLDDLEIRARYLVGADGARSKVAAALGLGRNHRFLVGAEFEYEGIGGLDESCLHVMLDSALAPGYIAWVVPGVGMAQVGLACAQPHLPRVEQLVERLRPLLDFSRARIVSRRGGLIPVGGPVRRMGGAGAMLVGDAAGMVSPLTAGGIHTALHFGRRAGVAICDHLLDGGPDPAAVVRQEAPRFLHKRALRLAMELDPPNAVYEVMLRSRVCRAAAQAVFFHHRGLLSPACWRDMARLAWG